jgi:hypothetical protein
MRYAVTVLSCAWLLGCGSAGQTSSYAVVVRALDDLDIPLPGVALKIGSVALGVTDAAGQRNLSVPGSEGQRVDVVATCPTGYEGPREPPTLALKRMQSLQGSGTQPIELRVICQSKQHLEVVAVRSGQPGLPILLRGQQVAYTSSTGTAHVLVRDAVGSSFQLTLDTGAKPELRPESPTRMFTVAQRDAFSVWDQPFESDKKITGSKKHAKHKPGKGKLSAAAPPAPPPVPRHIPERLR